MNTVTVKQSHGIKFMVVTEPVPDPPLALTLPSGTHRLPNGAVVELNWEAEPDVTERQIWGGDSYSVCGYILRPPAT